MRITILGAGAGAASAAVDLTNMGHDVTLCTTYEPDLRNIIPEIEKRGGIEYTGAFGEGLTKVRTSADLSRAKDADVIMIITLAMGHEFYARQLAGVLRPDQLVLLNPGYPGGSLQFARILREANRKERFKLAELNNLAYACRSSSPSQVLVLKKANYLLFSSFPGNATDELLDQVKAFYPFVHPAQNVLECGMMNPNVTVHPAGTISNAGWIEATKGEFYYYSQGHTPSVSRVMEELDGERLKVCGAAGIRSTPITEYYYEAGYSSVRGKGVYQMFQNSEVNRKVKAPASLDHRFLNEDIAYGLVPISAIARLVGVGTPTMDALIQLASALTGIDYRSKGLGAEKMGIAGMDKTAMIRFVNEGYPR